MKPIAVRRNHQAGETRAIACSWYPPLRAGCVAEAPVELFSRQRAVTNQRADALTHFLDRDVQRAGYVEVACPRLSTETAKEHAGRVVRRAHAARLAR